METRNNDMFKVQNNEILFQSIYGYLPIQKVTEQYILYGFGSFIHRSFIQKPTYDYLLELMRKYNVEL